ncbi:MAG: DUF4360 domain-containing protein [Polyangiales bacterium]
MSLLGCAAEVPGSEQTVESAESALAGKTVKLSPANGAYTVTVAASGTGCPTKETWIATLTPDGTNLKVDFTAYEVFIDPTLDRLSLNCAIEMKFNTKRKQTVEVEAISYTGYAYLEAGVTATQKVEYTFGAKNEAGTSLTTLTGPYDNDYLITDTLPSPRKKASKCGKDHKLTADTALTAINGNPRANAYVNTRDLSGDVTVGVRVKVKDCD